MRLAGLLVMGGTLPADAVIAKGIKGYMCGMHQWQENETALRPIVLPANVDSPLWLGL